MTALARLPALLSMLLATWIAVLTLARSSQACLYLASGVLLPASLHVEETIHWGTGLSCPIAPHKICQQQIPKAVMLGMCKGMYARKRMCCDESMRQASDKRRGEPSPVPGESAERAKMPTTPS